LWIRNGADGEHDPLTRSWEGRKEDPLHIVMLSLMIAMAACLLLLIAFGLFTKHLDG